MPFLLADFCELETLRFFKIVFTSNDAAGTALPPGSQSLEIIANVRFWRERTSVVANTDRTGRLANPLTVSTGDDHT
jgi:hypothetical protein